MIIVDKKSHYYTIYIFMMPSTTTHTSSPQREHGKPKPMHSSSSLQADMSATHKRVAQTLKSHQRDVEAFVKNSTDMFYVSIFITMMIVVAGALFLGRMMLQLSHRMDVLTAGSGAVALNPFTYYRHKPFKPYKRATAGATDVEKSYHSSPEGPQF